MHYNNWSDWQAFVKKADSEYSAMILATYHAMKDKGQPIAYTDALK